MARSAADPPLPAAVADTVAKLRRAMRKAAQVRRPGMPLSVAQLELLSVVEEHPGPRPGDLARLLRLAPNSVSTLANALVGAGTGHRATATSASPPATGSSRVHPHCRRRAK